MEDTTTNTTHLSESKAVYIASEISLILADSPDSTHFSDEEQTEITNWSWVCVEKNGVPKLVVSLWKDSTLCLHQADGYSFDRPIIQRLIGLAGLATLDWKILSLDDEPDEDIEEEVIKHSLDQQGVLH